MEPRAVTRRGEHPPDLRGGPIAVWQCPKPHQLGAGVEQFLGRLGRPTWLHVYGRDRTRTRALVTLQHGNEPSGARALHAWLRTEPEPAVDMLCLVASVRTALRPPVFSHRTLPGRRDLNRCFRVPFVGPEGQLAAQVLAQLRQVRPEALIDLHNTSGSGPAYAVATRDSAACRALTLLFSHELVLTDLILGALMEATSADFPTLTIECGGAQDSAADRVAREGLERYATADPLFELEGDGSLPRLLRHPVRVELRPGAVLRFGFEAQQDADLTLRSDIDTLNFRTVPSGEVLGWLGPRGLDALRAFDTHGHELAGSLFREADGQLQSLQPLRPLMITTNVAIACSDCLFYVVRQAAS